MKNIKSKASNEPMATLFAVVIMLTIIASSVVILLHVFDLGMVMQ